MPCDCYTPALIFTDCCYENYNMETEGASCLVRLGLESVPHAGAPLSEEIQQAALRRVFVVVVVYAWSWYLNDYSTTVVSTARLLLLFVHFVLYFCLETTLLHVHVCIAIYIDDSSRMSYMCI